MIYVNNILPDLLSRLYEPLNDHKGLAVDGDKRQKKLEHLLLRSKGSKKRFQDKKTSNVKSGMEAKSETVTKKKKIFNKNKKLNILAVKIKSKKSDGVAYVAPPEDERDRLLRETHDFGHFGSYSIVQKLHSQGIH
ncbi:MAG: hypothetical protein EXX96DRAFT_622277 [Benjaminiella poitrasii]|nr:MAG: hypothetical protein EXX96DRAFT_622277 [Benjaminiella poitrasii]